MKDLTQEGNVVELMVGSNSEQEWNDNCDLVKKANNGYPPFWYASIIMSGLSTITTQSFGSNADITITAL